MELKHKEILNKYADQKLIFTRDTIEGRLSEAAILTDVHDDYLVFKSIDTGHYSLKNIHFDTQNDLTAWLDEHVIGYREDVEGLVINWRFKKETMKIFADNFPSNYDYESNYSEASETYYGSIVFDLDCSRYAVKKHQDLTGDTEYLMLNADTLFLQYDTEDTKFFIRPMFYPFAKIQYVIQSSTGTQSIMSQQYLDSCRRFQSNTAQLFIDTSNYLPEYHKVSNRDAVDFFASFLLHASFVGDLTYWVPYHLINVPSPKELIHG